MELTEKAKYFAINAHKGQVRKSEPDKPMIIHPISVGELLKEYGCDSQVIAAGFLHDVVEDTSYTLEDIQKEFGTDIASLVQGASEPDKSLSWEERKAHTIAETRKLPLRNKLVICADKINNLEDLLLKFQKSGVRDFSAFKRGEQSQKWYYQGVYEALIFQEDPNLPLFKRLKDAIENFFDYQEDLYLKDTIFVGHNEYYERLKRLHAQKIELQRLKALNIFQKPFVIEFTGTPHTGITTIISNLYDFFKKGGFSVSVIEEFTSSSYYKETFQKKYGHLSKGGFNLAIMERVYNQLMEALKMEKDIILIDRSINDRQIWNYRCYQKDYLSESQYNDYKSLYGHISHEFIDFLVITYADALTAVKREYVNSLALEKRSFINEQNIEQYNNALRELRAFLETTAQDFVFLDTNSMDINNTSVEVAFHVLPLIRKRYIKNFEERYHLK